VAPADDERTLVELAGNAVAIVARGNSLVTRSVIRAAPHLKVIGRTGIGYDSIDIEAATESGIPVVVTPDATTYAVAEGVLAMMLGLAKRLSELTTAVRLGDWNARSRLAILDLEGATLGIIGLGRIGQRVAHLATAFGMQIVAHDPYVNDSAIPKHARSRDLESVLRESDFLTLHCPLTAETTGLISYRNLELCKRGLLLVNLGRGPLVDLDALYVALLSGQVGGAALDVFDPEPPPAGHPLLVHPRVVLTPHALALTVQGRHRIFADLAQTMALVLRSEHSLANARASIVNYDDLLGLQ